MSPDGPITAADRFGDEIDPIDLADQVERRDQFHAGEETLRAILREQAIDDRRQRRLGLRRDLEHGTMGRRGDLHQQGGNRIRQ